MAQPYTPYAVRRSDASTHEAELRILAELVAEGRIEREGALRRRNWRPAQRAPSRCTP